MENHVAKIEQASAAVTRKVENDIFAIATQFESIKTVAEYLLRSNFLPSTIKTPQQVAVIILKGQELGFKLMQSFEFINVIQNKPSLSPQGMLALINSSPVCDTVKVIASDEKKCTVMMRRTNGVEHTGSFTIEMASKMKTKEDGKVIALTEKFNWRTMPATMLQWRAVAAVARIVFPDVIGGMYLTEELESSVDATPVQPVEPSTTDTAPVIEVQSEVITKGKTIAPELPAELAEAFQSFTQVARFADLEGDTYCIAKGRIYSKSEKTAFLESNGFVENTEHRCWYCELPKEGVNS
ncbi:recombinase RecT [Geotalea sp. SG265]|uniref:recombinase RecT n=1 Tax=Geotalea sp. SG265 TaxID=2922867 RepID=UPI001FAF46C4|nr:recombinase RecT [Geotalea sp. SG265]